MKNLKKWIIIGTILAVAAIAVLIYCVAFKNRSNSDSETNLHGFYTIENKDFGYKFEMSDEYFRGYQESRQGYSTTYSIPIGDGGLDDIFAITAIPLEVARENEKLCAAGKESHPIQCVDYENSIGKNNYFYFDFRGSQQSELLGMGDKEAQLFETINEAVKSKLEFFDIANKPNTLTYIDKREGYEYQYPAFINNSFLENQSLQIAFDFGKDGATSMSQGFIKDIPIKYCAPSGKCTPTTRNFNITVGSIFISEQQLLKSEIGKSLTKIKIEDYTIYLYKEGAEGEGIDYYFAVSPLPNLITVVAHKYIDETVVRTYLTAKEFTPYREQKKIAVDIIKSLTYFTPYIKNN